MNIDNSSFPIQLYESNYYNNYQGYKFLEIMTT